MDLSAIKLCRLCLQSNDDFVNIWEAYQDSTIASIVTKHFWFQINKGDGLTEFICDVCWIQTKTFHHFYKQIELHQKRLYDSVVKDAECQDKAVETTVNVEEPDKTELRSDAIDSQINSEHNDPEDDHVYISSESEVEQNDADQEQNEARKVANGKAHANKKVQPSAVKERLRLSPSEKAELEGQIRDLFKMTCELCSGVTFRTLLDAEKHYRSAHQKRGYIMCCGRAFHDTAKIVDHIRYHMETNGPPEEEAEIREWFAMKCDVCSDRIEFETLTEMKRHFRIVHNMRGYLRCTCCGKKCKSRTVMLSHIPWHTDPDTLRCGQCDKVFASKFSLRCHIANHTPSHLRPFACTLCPSKFALAASLRSHVKNGHTAKTGEKFNCDRCTKSFQSNYLLSLHIRNTHESTTEYVCEICARTLKTKQSLRDHFARFHSSKPPAKVQCDVCGVWVKRLYNHRRVHESTDPVNCPVCNKAAPSKEALVLHVKYVHGEKRHRCQLCSKAFVCRKTLKEHLATHTGENLYDCGYCEKKFKWNANMYKHRKNAHSAEWARYLKAKTTTDEQVQPAGSE